MVGGVEATKRVTICLCNPCPFLVTPILGCRGAPLASRPPILNASYPIGPFTEFCIKTWVNLFVPAKHPIKATKVWPVTVTCASFSFSSFRCIFSWLTSPRSVAPVDYSFTQLLVNLRRHDRDMPHFGCFAQMFGRDKQMFRDSRLQVFMQNSVKLLQVIGARAVHELDACHRLSWSTHSPSSV